MSGQVTVRAEAVGEIRPKAPVALHDDVKCGRFSPDANQLQPGDGDVGGATGQRPDQLMLPVGPLATTRA